MRIDKHILSVLAAMIFFALPALAGAAEKDVQLRAGSSEHSVFKSVWVAILEEAGIEVNLQPARAKVRRFWFVENDIQLDCCSIPEWRQRPAEVAAQLYTNTIFQSVQFFIHHKDMAIQYTEPRDLSAYRVGVISGHTHVYEEYFRERVEVPNFRELFKLIADGKADIASVNEQEFKFQMGQDQWPIVRGPVFHRLALRARVRKEHVHLLPRLNDAIARMRAAGRIDEIIGKAMRGEMFEEQKPN